MLPEKDDTRLHWVDLLRGFAMLAILWFHTEMYYAGRDLTPYACYVQDVLATFFFLSGYVFNPYTPPRKQLLSTARRLLWPYLLFTTLLAVPKALAHGQMLSLQVIEQILNGHASWFVASLVTARLLFIAVLRITRRHPLALGATAIVAATMASQLGNSHADFYYAYDLWCINESLLALVFLIAGHLYRRYVVLQPDPYIIPLLIVGLFITKTTIFMFDLKMVFGFIDITHMGFFLGDTLFACLLLTQLFSGLPPLAPLQWVGRHSLVCYFLCGAVPFVVSAGMNRVGLAFDDYPYLLPVVFVAVCAVTVAATWAIHRFLPWLTRLAVLLLLPLQAQAQQLPVVRLYGQFGYDYSQATVVYDHPDSLRPDTLAARIKWRGGTTNTPDKHKRNYKIKFGEDHRLLGLRNDNNWLLDAGQPDPFRLRNRVATDLWLSFATPPYYHDQEPKARSGARGGVVEVYLNDAYEGVYSLMENVDRKQLRLRKATADSIHGVLWKAKGFGASMMYNMPEGYDNWSSTWDTFEAKYPEPGDDLDSTDYQTLYRAISFVINAKNQEFQEQAAQYFDLPVVLDYYLFINVIGAVDNAGKNTFWAVYDQADDPRLTLAVWDLDATVGQPWTAKIDPKFTRPDYHIGAGIRLIERLLKLNVDDFQNKAVQRYSELRNNKFHTDSLKARYRAAYELLRASGADEREAHRWSGDTDIDGATIDLARETDYICQWLEEHLEYLDQQFGRVAVSGITEAPRHPSGSGESPDVFYTLTGRPIDTPQRPGLYITQGRKLIVK